MLEEEKDFCAETSGVKSWKKTWVREEEKNWKVECAAGRREERAEGCIAVVGERRGRRGRLEFLKKLEMGGLGYKTPKPNSELKGHLSK